MCVGGQWYVFYHRMTNGTIMSRRGCVEKIEILPDGTIPQVEATSLGFRDSLNPYEITPADIACVLTGGALITEKTVFERVITNIHEDTVIGYKYFDFGDDFGGNPMQFAADINGMGCDCCLHILIDGADGTEIGSVKIGHGNEVVTADVSCVTGRHSVFFKVTTDYPTPDSPDGWAGKPFRGRCLFELKSFVFMK